MCSIGGTQNIGENMAKAISHALPSMGQGIPELLSCCITDSLVNKLAEQDVLAW